MKIILLGNPISTNQIYRRHGNIIYMSKEGKSIKEQYRFDAIQQRNMQRCTIPMAKRLEVKIELHFKDKRIRDIDNYNKILLDALTGIVWYDDKQIHKMTVEKFIDKENPRIEIEVL